MKVIIDKKEVIDDLIAKKIIDLVNLKKDANLGLATGSSPLGVYANLVKDYINNKTDYSNIKTFNLDEYINLPLDHKESYHTFMYNNLFSKININKENTYFPLEENYKNYSNLLKENQIDLQVLGIGSNGHIGFNEPKTPFTSKTDIVLLAEQTRKDNARFFPSIDDVPTHAISMGLSDIMLAKEIVLIATGKAKAEAIYHLVKGKQTEAWPATILQSHKNITIYLDADAASLLK